MCVPLRFFLRFVSFSFTLYTVFYLNLHICSYFTFFFQYNKSFFILIELALSFFKPSAFYLNAHCSSVFSSHLHLLFLCLFFLLCFLRNCLLVFQLGFVFGRLRRSSLTVIRIRLEIGFHYVLINMVFVSIDVFLMMKRDNSIFDIFYPN